MLLLSLVLLAAPAPLRVAVPNFNVVNVPTETAAFFMDRFANRLRADGLAVTTASEIEAVLGLERQKTLLGCAEQSSSCQAEIASALGADAIVRARVARFGDRFELSVTLIDPASAGVIASNSASAADEGKLLIELDATADVLSEKFFASRRARGLAVPEVSSTASSGARPGWVPLVPLGLGVGAAATGAVLLAQSFDKVKQIESSNDPQKTADEAKLDRGLGITLLGVGAVGLATGAILFFTGKEPVVTPVAALSHDGAWVGFEGRLP